MLNLVLCWHMHQPDYRHRGQYLRPWTWLHALKDYSDMVAHLEAEPGMRAVVNFSSILLVQLQDYPRRIERSLQTGVVIGDRILDALAGRLPPRSDHAGELTDEQAGLLQSLLRVNEATVKPRFEPYARLHAQARHALGQNQNLERGQLDDLLVWYVLAWTGETLRGRQPFERLAEKARDFSEKDRLDLLSAVADVIGALLPRYRALAHAGQIELSLTPYAHPILPLLQDMHSARDAWPDVVLPGGEYPGGDARCVWHIAEARRVFREAFELEAAGCWPSEGGVSSATLRLLEQEGFGWAASGAQVLHNSLDDHGGLSHLKPWRLAGSGGGRESLSCFFRDDELSDRIGFEYSKWNAQDAVGDFISRLEHKAERFIHQGQGEPVLSIIMDGENAWEYFPCNATEFLSCLYQRLANHPHFRLTTFSEVRKTIEPKVLNHLKAGSWVYGTFSTWVGDAAKNRAWDVLIAAKQAVDAALAPELEWLAASGEPQTEWMNAVLHQLAVCEASDWFWWLGEDNQLEDGPAFDLLFRQQVAALYELIGQSPPASLDKPLNDPLNGEQGSRAVATHGQHPETAGAMKPTVQHH